LSTEEKVSSFGGHNYKADFRFKLTSGMKANGENQLKELTVRSDESEGLMEQLLDIQENWYKAGKKRHLKMVSPYEDGHEPTI